jgi:hypothetical protein
MKKISFLIAVLLIGITMVSCNKESNDDAYAVLKTAYVDQTSTPTSLNGVVPVILAVDKPRGGNVTCNDVSQAFGNIVLLCGDKIDYMDEVQFEGAFPEWLNVDVEGIYISFHMDECVMINNKYYKVGAVIVKGSNAANVYFYEGGTLSDSHLAAPGDKYMVSNLTFCFVECEQPPLVIALKTYFTAADWAVTSTVEIPFVGYYDFIPGFAGYKIYYSDYITPVGDLEIGNFDSDPELEVRINNNDMPGKLFREAYLFVGTIEEYNYIKTTYPTGFYYEFPYESHPASPVSSITFDLPF